MVCAVLMLRRSRIISPFMALLSARTAMTKNSCAGCVQLDQEKAVPSAHKA